MPPETQLFKALSDPTRREILERLGERDMTAGEIADGFDITKPSVSHHLAALKQAGLVLDVRRGRNIVYSLDTTVFQEAISWMLRIAGSARRAKGARRRPTSLRIPAP